MAGAAQLDPWNFGDNTVHFPSPDHSQKLEYSALTELSQGGPVGGPCFWSTAAQTRTLVHASCGGPPVWDSTGSKVALPVWENHWLHGIIARVGVLDTIAGELTVFAPRFRVLHLQQFNGRLIAGIDSPVYQLTWLMIDASTTPTKSVIQLNCRCGDIAPNG